MGRPRRYESNAARQKAYRERQKKAEAARQAEQAPTGPNTDALVERIMRSQRKSP